MKLSVIIPTYNPDKKRLEQTLAGLKNQTLDLNEWELIIIDNNSSNNFQHQHDIYWHPFACVVNENRQGLTYARLRGVNESKGEAIVMVDDDNILNSNYLEEVLNIFDQSQHIGAIGGKSVPLFETTPPRWLSEFYGSLALRDLGEHILTAKWNYIYPEAAPIGAGMCVRRKALDTYIRKITLGQNNISDRTATSLSSGGDNDIVLEILKSGWMVGYFPQLQLQHIIPQRRMAVNYLARLLHDTNRSWVQLLRSHDISPWKEISPKSVFFRKIKAWFTYQAWKNNAAYIHWRGACGMFEGQADLLD